MLLKHIDLANFGRKIILDTHGGAAPYGGSTFSGKYPNRVDRSAAYTAHYFSKNVVATGLAEKCMIQLSYAISVAHSLSIYSATFGTGQVSECRSKEPYHNVWISPTRIPHAAGPEQTDLSTLRCLRPLWPRARWFRVQC